MLTLTSPTVTLGSPEQGCLVFVRLLSLLLFVALAASVPLPADAALAESAVSCSVVLERGTPTVFVDNVQGSIGDRIVIERRVFSRYWWREASPTAAGDIVFVDGALPATSSRIDYRALIKRTDGSVIDTIGCELLTPDLLFACRVTATVGGYEGRFSTVFPRGIEIDHVVRRAIDPGQTSTSWRRVVRSGDRWSDGRSPTAVAQYQVIQRRDGVPYVAAPCSGGVTDLSCAAVSDATLAEATSLETMTVNSISSVEVLRFGPNAEDDRLLVRRAGSSPELCGPTGQLSVISTVPSGMVIVRGNVFNVLFAIDTASAGAPRALTASLSAALAVSNRDNVFALGTDGLIAIDRETARSTVLSDLDGGQAERLLVLGPDNALYFAIGDDPYLVNEAPDNTDSLARYDLTTGELARIAVLFGAQNFGQISVDPDGTVRYRFEDKDNVTERVFPPGTRI